MPSDRDARIVAAPVNARRNARGEIKKCFPPESTMSPHLAEGATYLTASSGARNRPHGFQAAVVHGIAS
jgi:hypothetical protein